MNKLILSVAVLATLMMSSVVFAQRPGRGGGDGPQRGGRGGQQGERGERGGRGGQPPVSPLMTALDADKDGKLSKEEIAGAAAALKALDKNKDGMLDASELAPQRGGRGGEGRPGGQRGGGDPSERVNQMFERDTDKDGKISKEEGGERMERFFDMMDGDKDGFLTREEVETAMSRFSGGGRGGRGGGGGRGGQAPKSKDNRPGFDDK